LPIADFRLPIVQTFGGLYSNRRLAIGNRQ